MTTTYTGTTYTHDSNVQVVGLPLIYATNGKNPAIAKRVFATFDQASGYTSNPDDTACAGLVITVTGDTSSKNGLYTVMSGGTTPTGLELKRAGGDLTIIEGASSTSGILKTYTFESNGTVLGTIDIPKDFFIKSASAYTISTQEQIDVTGIPSGHTCWDLLLNTSDGTEQHSYVDITDAIVLDAQSVKAKPITEADLGGDSDDVFISGNTVADQLRAIGIKIKESVPKISQENNSGNILHAYADGIGITSGATWDCGEW